MEELGMESSLVQSVLNGDKTVEGRLGKPRFRNIKVGDVLGIREDVWKGRVITASHHDRARICIARVYDFATFDEMLRQLDYRTVIPSAQSWQEAADVYRQFYTHQMEQDLGVVALQFAVVKQGHTTRA